MTTFLTFFRLWNLCCNGVFAKILSKKRQKTRLLKPSYFYFFVPALIFRLPDRFRSIFGSEQLSKMEIDSVSVFCCFLMKIDINEKWAVKRLKGSKSEVSFIICVLPFIRSQISKMSLFSGSKSLWSLCLWKNDLHFDLKLRFFWVKFFPN